jgi:hypothetical protein
MVAVAGQKRVTYAVETQKESNIERLLRLSEEAARGKLIDVTEMSDDDFFKVISRK